jgi:DNA-binding Lrp family transcriptional regulator
MDDIDRQIINALQGGFEICEHPFATAAAPLGLAEEELIGRIEGLLSTKVLSRFGPLYNPERLGGGVTLAAMSVPCESFDSVAETVNGFPEVAHNYERDHTLNMWFVIATDKPERIPAVIAEIERLTGLPVCDMPKLDEFYIGLKLQA